MDDVHGSQVSGYVGPTTAINLNVHPEKSYIIQIEKV